MSTGGWELPDVSPCTWGGRVQIGATCHSRDPLSQGTTGLISWQGAVLLSAWSDSFGDSVLAGKRVLELGRFLPITTGNIVCIIWGCRLRTRPLWTHPPRPTSPCQLLHLHRHSNDYDRIYNFIWSHIQYQIFCWIRRKLYVKFIW